MKLSEAMMLGSSLVKPMRGTLFNHGSFADLGKAPIEITEADYACANGMALLAVGHKCLENRARECKSYLRNWPWTNKLIVADCDCFPGSVVVLISTHIEHLFDEHVMTCRDMTFDRLVSWVAQQEKLLDSQQEESVDAPKARTLAVQLQTQAR